MTTNPRATTAEPGHAVAQTIDELRERIDELDASIIGLIAERARVSRSIQAARVSGGGARVELGRERVILGHYREGLGREGAHLADAVLLVCRGQR